MTRNGALTLFAIGLIALIAGVGRLVQRLTTTGEQDPVPLPALVGATIFGLLVVSLVVQSAAREYLGKHEDISGRQLWLAGVFVVGAAVLVFALGVLTPKP